MSMLDLLSDRETWERFYEYRAGLEDREAFCRELRRFLDGEEYLPVVRRIREGQPFPPASKAVISKMHSQKKRTVYTYPPAENMVLKMLTWLMIRRYDGLFAPGLYSFRPGCTAKDAIRRLASVPGIDGMYWYKADISNYFNSVPVPRFLPLLRETLAEDPALYEFLRGLLEEPYVLDRGPKPDREMKPDRGPELVREERGIMAGTPQSAFFANLYLAALDREMEAAGVPYARYSDDILILAESPEEVRRLAERVRERLAGLGLTLNPDKESFGSPEDGWSFLGFYYCRKMLDIAPASVTKIKQKMRRKSRALRRWAERTGAEPERAAAAFIRVFNRKLLGIRTQKSGAGTDSNDLTWSRWYFPVISTDRGLREIDRYAVDCLRFLLSGRRTKARFNVRYEDLKALGFRSLVHEYYKKERKGMKYNFDVMLERHGRDAIAVDAIGAQVDFAKAPEAPKEGFDAIPMWVADMNFPTVPTVAEAVIRRAEHPAYGYFAPTDEYYDSIIRWHRLRNGVEGLTREDIGYENGVLGCVASAMQAFTAPGEKFLLHSPTYIGFTHVLEDNGRRAELSPLVKDAEGVWRMDYEDMDRRLKENDIHFAIFCSPHNPCGRVWEREEIEKAMEVFKANDVVVVSDEIWSDIILDGHRHTPTQSVSEDARNRTIAVYAPSKTFNLAGLIGSYHIIYNKYLRDRVLKQSAACHYNDMNVLSMHALIGAYSDEGYIWADELCSVLSKNVYFAYDFVKEHFPGVEAGRPEGTYMMLLHCEDYCKKTGRTIDEVIKAGWDVGVAWQQGAPFHDPWGIRMNFAVPYTYVAEAMDRLKKYVFI